jgi:tetratricopeptide (TPR) repeat protein
MAYVDNGLKVFLENKRRPIVFFAILVVAVSISFVIVTIARDERNKEAIKLLEDYLERYEKLTDNSDVIENNLTGDAAILGEGTENTEIANNEGSVEKESQNKEKMDLFIADFSEFAGKYSGYPSAKAWSVIADVYYGRALWKEAEDAYIKSAVTAKNIYIAPVSYYNAAVCAEESNNIDSAIEYYTKASEYPDFPQGSHAQFSIGRLYEEQNKNDLAKSAYQAVVDNWTRDNVSDNEWISLANSRLIALQKE